MVYRNTFVVPTALSLSQLLSSALAHDHGGHILSSPDTAFSEMPPVALSATANDTLTMPQSYFSYPESSGLIWAHIVVMVVAWFFILPIGESLPGHGYMRMYS